MTPAPLDGVAWEDLAVLIATAEHGSLSRASRALRISQSTASRRLVRIEEALGTPLFDRTASGLLLTDFGERLLPYARLIAGHMADIARLASGAEVRPQGRVRLALPDGIAAAVVDVARRASKFQSGYVYHYAFAMLVGVAILVTWYMVGAGG